MHLLFITGELAPLSGHSSPLGRQIAALGGALCTLGHKVTAVTPLRSPEVVDRFSFARRLSPLTITLPRQEVAFHVFDGKLPSGVEVKLLRQPDLFEGAATEDDGDQPLRHFTFARAALRLAQEESSKTAPWHIVHGFSLPGAFAPWLAARTPELVNARTILSVQSLERRGRCDRMWVDRLGLSWDDFTPEGFEFYGELDLLKAGLVSAHRLLFDGHSLLADACSEGGGHGLDGLLRSRRAATAALLPGLDFARWNPTTDPVIPVRFDAAQHSGKRSCKAHLQNLVGLPVRPQAALFGLTPPLDELAGPLAEVLERLLRGEVQLIAPTERLDPALDGLTQELAQRFPRQVARCAFDDKHVRLVLSGADFMVLDAPQEDAEPLLAALRYGALPITSARGLARDLVVDLDGSLDSGNGLLVQEAEGLELLATLQRACAFLRGGLPFQDVLSRAMSLRCSFEDRARQLEELYSEMLPLTEGVEASPEHPSA